jgi:HTH-type transcriptional regulator/antitoxin HigA
MITEEEYNKYVARIDELIDVVSDNTPETDPKYEELMRISFLVEEFELEHFPMEIPSLIDVIKLRMEEEGLKQKDLAELLGTTTSRISEYIRGKREITLHMAKQLHKKLNIDASIILQ